jgi:hypothetical protein
MWRGGKLTTHCLLVPGLRISAALPPLLPTPACCASARTVTAVPCRNSNVILPALQSPPPCIWKLSASNSYRPEISYCEQLAQTSQASRGQLKCDGTRAETRFRLSTKRTSPLNRRGRQFSRMMAAEVCASAFIVGSNAGYIGETQA